MTDIIERLRAAVPTYEGTPIAWPCEVSSELLLEAAAEVERLREVIRTIRARCVELDDSDAVSETLDITSAVLEDRP